MDKLCLVRHGRYNITTGLLNEPGKEEMENLAKKLERFISGKSVVILSSKTPRARESADILSKYFQVEYEEHGVLCSGPDKPEDLPEAFKLVQANSERADVLVIVTHMEYALKFPGYFIRQTLNLPSAVQEIEKGEAVIIDCAGGSILYMRKYED